MGDRMEPKETCAGCGEEGREEKWVGGWEVGYKRSCCCCLRVSECCRRKCVCVCVIHAPHGAAWGAPRRVAWRGMGPRAVRPGARGKPAAAGGGGRRRGECGASVPGTPRRSCAASSSQHPPAQCGTTALRRSCCRPGPATRRRLAAAAVPPPAAGRRACTSHAGRPASRRVGGGWEAARRRQCAVLASQQAAEAWVWAGAPGRGCCCEGLHRHPLPGLRQQIGAGLKQRCTRHGARHVSPLRAIEPLGKQRRGALGDGAVARWIESGDASHWRPSHAAGAEAGCRCRLSATPLATAKADGHVPRQIDPPKFAACY